MSIKSQPNTDPKTQTESTRILRHADVCSRLGVGKSTLFAMVARNLFPEPFQIIPGGRATGWLEFEVDAWIDARRKHRAEGGSK